VLDGLEAVYVERLDSPHTLRIFSRVGHRLPAHCTSSGKVLLAGLPRRRSTPAWPSGSRWR
jgi:IclR family transcriptional regulator, KDG regulon repressor